MAPPRRGQLRLRKDGWYARVRSGVGTDASREWFRLGTTDRAEAQRRLRQLVTHAGTGRSPRELAENTPEATSVAAYAESWTELRKAQGVVMARDEWSYLSKYALPTIGPLPLSSVTTEHVALVIERAILAGLAKGSVRHIRGALNRMFDHAWRTKKVHENPVLRAPKTPKIRETKRSRVVLTDDEIIRYLACASVDLELRMMSAVARMEGGMRTGDVNGWDWTMIDTVTFASCVVPRSKTDTDQELEVPDVLRHALREWWERAGRPASGPVFPVRTGKRKGKTRATRGTSYANRLRRDLLRAGVVRHECTRLEDAPPRTAKEACCPNLALDPIYSKTARTMPVDFHSFRRAFNTALARTGVNVQTAMRLAGHSDAKTHMRYVLAADAPELRRIPSSALPLIGSDSLRTENHVAPDATRLGPTEAQSSDAPFAESSETGGIIEHSGRATQNSNLRPSASEAVSTSVSYRNRTDANRSDTPHDRARFDAVPSDWASLGLDAQGAQKAVYDLANTGLAVRTMTDSWDSLEAVVVLDDDAAEALDSGRVPTKERR